MNIDRRNFIRGTAVLGAMGVAGALAGCSAPKNAADAAPQSAEPVADATVQADIVIVGAGMSGLAAAVQAGIDGDKTIVLESTATVGGSGFGVEGIFGWNTKMQQELGLEFDKNLVLRSELAAANYGTDGALWEILIDDSASNIDWLVDQGVTFSGLVDAYEVRGTAGIVPSMHWFEEGIAKVGYVPAMQKRCEELGVQIVTGARATALAMEDGAVKGVYAETSQGLVKYEAGAVLIASGGWTTDETLLAKHGIDPTCLLNANTSDQNGDGIKMAVDAGAREFLRPCIEGVTTLPGLNADRDTLAAALGLAFTPVWVNQDAKRFTNEDCGEVNFELPVTTIVAQRASYMIFTRAIAEERLRSLEADIDALDAWFAKSPDMAWRGRSIAELAAAAGLDPDALTSTIEEYNGFCRQQSDTTFGKKPEYLTEITGDELYMARIWIHADTTIGGIVTDKDARVLSEEGEPIEGLYAVGVAGCMLYRDGYPIDVCATACQNSINSGRKAALHAHERLGSAS